MRSVRRIRGRVGSMLGLLALAPLIGLTVLSYGRIAEANRSAAELKQVQEATASLVELVELQASIQNESFWFGSAFYVGQSNVSPSIARSLLGTDPMAEAANAKQRTNDLVASVDVPGLAAAVEEARSETSSLDQIYQPLDRVVAELVDPAVRAEVGQVIELAAEQRNGSSLVVFARELEATNQLRSQFSLLRSHFFANFAELEADQQRTALARSVDTLAVYNNAMETIDFVVPPGAPIAEQLDDLRNNPDRQTFLVAVDELFAVRGQTDYSFGETSISVLQPVVRSFTTAGAASEEHLNLVRLAATVLAEEAEAQQAEARRTAMMVLVGTLVVALMSLGAIVAATRWIVKPLSALGRAALALTLGGSGSLTSASGPREIRLIHDALAEAIDNLERTEQQALALADGALDDPSLEQVVPGRFGATLNAAIEQLRSSISFQEQFSDQLAYEAGHDGLTGLANRRSSIELLARLLDPEIAASDPDDSNRKTTVFFIDLDHFKKVNDTHGHAAGDAVLCTVAEALTSSARRNDVVGRIGGDEFLVVSGQPISPEEAVSMGERYLDAITDALRRTDSELGASIGVAIGEPGADVDSLLAEADIAMLEAKKGGRNGVRFFDVELRERTSDELTLSTNIRAGLSLGEFELHYQPIVDSVSGSVLDYEALIRWNRPGVGIVPPDDYIPFAERSDLVIAIDQWVLQEAATTLSSSALGDIGIAVNISGRHLARGDLYGDLTDVLTTTGIDPQHLTVEITESALLGDIDGAIDTLRRIRETGVKVAIDDFGTGFTSLTHLRNLPADVLKIDQSFTSNLDNSDDANLVRLVIQTAHILRLDVVVEGVENVHQAQRVTMLGADQMQGYYFAKPKPLDQIVAGSDLSRVDFTKHPTSSPH